MNRSVRFDALNLTITLVLIVMASSATFAQKTPETPDEKAPAIRAVLEKQVAAWNRGDLEGYMDGYWRSPELEFYGGDKVTRGWDATLARYHARYLGEGKEMGTLAFGDLEVHANTSNVAWVSGRWRLKMKDGSERSGLFTVIFHKFPDGWKIIHDHSS